MALPVIPVFLILGVGTAFGFGLRGMFNESTSEVPKNDHQPQEDHFVGAKDPVFDDEYVNKINAMSLSRLEAELKAIEAVHSRHWINKNPTGLNNTKQMLSLIHTRMTEVIACEGEARKHWGEKLTK